MRLNLDEDLILLSDSAASFLADASPVAAIRTLRGGDAPFDRALWDEMVAMGWPAILAPEAYGGLAMGYRGMGLLLEHIGRTVTLSPMLSSALVATTLLVRAASEELKARLLPGMAAGRVQVALAIDETPHHAPERIEAQARRDGGGYVLNGRKGMVMNASAADWLIVVARAAENPAEWVLLLVDPRAEGITMTRQALVDEADYARIEFNAVRVAAANRIGDAGNSADALDFTLAAANIGLASELYGLASQAHRITVAYLKERRQFGVPIGSFQALQHRASHMAAELEMSLSAVRMALAALDENDPRLLRIASAVKVKLAQCAYLVTTEAIQMHGGMGMTDEVEVGFFLKRVRVAQAQFGDVSYHLNRYAALKGY